MKKDKIKMMINEIIAGEIFDHLDYMYCDNCRHDYHESKGYDKDACDFCYRKYNGWGVRYKTCEGIADRIIERINKEVMRIDE